MDEKIETLNWPTIDFNFDQKPSNIVHIDMKIDEKSIDAMLDEIELEYPHVSNRLSLLVGFPEFETAMNSYLVDTRGNRKGFSKHVITCLLKLSRLHTEKYGHLIITKDPWHSGHKY